MAKYYTMIEENEKYAILTFSHANAQFFEGEIKVDENLLVTSKFPIEIDDNWKKWIGEIQTEKIKNSNLSILYKFKVENPQLIGIDNIECESKVYRFYCSLVIRNELLCDYFPLQISGAKYNNFLEVQGFTQLLKPEFVNGTPFSGIDENLINDGIQNYYALNYLSTIKKHARVFRAINYFLSGITSYDWRNKFHNFVRVIEAFINPEIGNTHKQFKSRTELFIGSQFHDLMGKIYSIRSNIEHVHEIGRGIIDLNDFEFHKMTIVTQSIARYIISYFLKNQNIWSYFEDSKIDTFWKLTPEERNKIWPDIYDVNKQLNEIERLI